MNTDRQRRALAARQAHLAMLDLRKVVDEVATTIHTAELEAVHLAISAKSTGDITTTLRVAMERLGPAHIEVALAEVREKLQTALS
jgi:hypothetical protein